MSVTFTASPRVKEGENIAITIERTGSDLTRTESFRLTSAPIGSNAFPQAIKGIDFLDNGLLDNNITLTAGEASRTLLIKAQNDTDVEGTEYINWQLTSVGAGPPASLLNNFASTSIENVEISTYTLTYLDPAVTVVEGQDIVLRMKLNTANHSGISFRATHFNSPTGNQFYRSDLVNQDSTTYIFPVVSFAPGTDYTELRIRTVDDTVRELDKTIQMLPNLVNTLEGQHLQLLGSPVITLLDNDWGIPVAPVAPLPPITNYTPVNNVTNITVTGNNNTVSVANNVVTTYNTTIVDGRSYNDIKGTATEDVLTGTADSDYFDGGDGNDNLTGGQGEDYFMGGLGDDILIGNQGNDQLFGGQGADVLWGGKGDDLLCPQKGNDIIYGNLGADKFILCKGQDTIKDFNFADGDRILIFGDLSTVSYGMSTAGNLEIRRDGDVTTLEGITFATFDPTKSIIEVG
jgi:Ca2+-binding RTX toxin-like protein